MFRKTAAIEDDQTSWWKTRADTLPSNKGCTGV